MSVTSDVKIVLKKENYQDLFNLISASELDEFDKLRFKNGQIINLKQNYIGIAWDYIRWDLDTDDLVSLIENFLYVLKKENIPYKYMVLNELTGLTTTISYGRNEDDIAFLNGVIYPKNQIVFDEYYLERGELE